MCIGPASLYKKHKIHLTKYKQKQKSKINQNNWVLKEMEQKNWNKIINSAYKHCPYQHCVKTLFIYYTFSKFCLLFLKLSHIFRVFHHCSIFSTLFDIFLYIFRLFQQFSTFFDIFKKSQHFFCFIGIFWLIHHTSFSQLFEMFNIFRL